jgi:thiol-disulfide isomerase/thioredoxin
VGTTQAARAHTLYQASWSRGLTGWTHGGPAWTTGGGKLSYSGADASSLLAPVTIAGGSYAVQATIRMLAWKDTGVSENHGFGIRVRSRGAVDPTTGTAGLMVGIGRGFMGCDGVYSQAVVDHSLAAQRGHPVLLEFFATWCPHCHREAPVVAKVTKAYGPKGVRVWAILANPYGPNYEASAGKDVHVADTADLVDYAQTYGANYPLLIDPEFATVNRYGAQGYPTIYLIDRTGKVASVSKGEIPYALLAKQIDRLTARTAL